MLSFIFIIILALAFGYFSTQNTHTTSINLASYSFSGLPLYIVLIATLALGIFLSWINNFYDTILYYFTLHGNEKEIKQGKGTIKDLAKRINELELENAKLKGQITGATL